MNINPGLFISIIIIPCISVYAAPPEREYNTWYGKDAVLFDMTQDDAGLPVMLSIAQAGFKTASLVITLLNNGPCPEVPPALDINGSIIPAAYNCMPAGEQIIESYIVSDAGRINGMVANLKSGFTLVIQNRIKVWAANIQKPVYGIAPGF